ncbi:MAG: mechanosensitive ion channel family protein [Clostridia bacterium]|nr:mechanosensitive ion channel family protein [Clostridia bacterium]
MDWKGIWQTIVDFFKTNVWGIVLFFIVLFAGITIIKVTINLTNRLLNRAKMEKIAQQFIMGAVKVALYLILVLILLSMMGIEITGIITALSALILAVGMALQNNIANLANGVIIVATKMFKKGDWISVNGVSGGVVDINFFFTTINTADNKRVTIPNSSIVNGEVENAGANKTRRVDFTFSVAYETDVEVVKKIILDVMKSNGKVIDNDKNTPFCRLKTLGSSSIDFFANCWVDKEDYWDVYYYVVENVYNEFKRNNISIPYNQLEVRTRTDTVVMPFNKEPLASRVEKVRNEEEEFDLETADLTQIFKHKKSKKKTKKAKEAKTEVKAETKTEEKKN